MTPITWNRTLLRTTCWPIGSRPVGEDVARPPSAPAPRPARSSARRRARRTCRAPSASCGRAGSPRRSRSPASGSRGCRTRAVTVPPSSGTAASTLGSAAIASASSGVMVAVLPPAAPRLDVAGRTEQEVGAHAADAVEHGLSRAVADRQHRDDRAHADDDAEQRERGAEEVRAQRAPGRLRGLEPAAGTSRAGRAGARGARRRRCRRPRTRIAHDAAVADLDHAVGMRRHLRRVGDQDDGVALPREVLEQRQHLGAALAVERAGGLVGEDDLAAVHQRARDRHALLLAARQLVRPVLEPVGRARASSSSARARSCRSARRQAGVDRGHLDVLGRASRRRSGCSSGTRSRTLRGAAAPARRARGPTRPRRGSDRCPSSGGRGSRGCSSASTCPSPRRP